MNNALSNLNQNHVDIAMAKEVIFQAFVFNKLLQNPRLTAVKYTTVDSE